MAKWQSRLWVTDTLGVIGIVAVVGLLVGPLFSSHEEPKATHSVEADSQDTQYSDRHSHYDSFGEESRDDSPYCPEGGSKEAAQSQPSPHVLDKDTKKDILVIAVGATVRLVGDISVTGEVRVCGAGATLVIDAPHPELHGLISGGGARVLIIDPKPDVEYFDSEKVELSGGGAEVVKCSTERTDIRSCDAYYIP